MHEEGNVLAKRKQLYTLFSLTTHGGNPMRGGQKFDDVTMNNGQYNAAFWQAVVMLVGHPPPAQQHNTVLLSHPCSISRTSNVGVLFTFLHLGHSVTERGKSPINGPCRRHKCSFLFLSFCFSTETIGNTVIFSCCS